MHIHIIGVCGTFMAGIAALAKARGIRVTGCDEHIYPPMSDILQALEIEVTQGYGVTDFNEPPDLYVIGNAAKRGMPIIEDILTHKKPYVSGPEWLYQSILRTKKVIAVSGTHGKTTTSSLLAWTLECAGLNPSFLIGGVPANFSGSARLTESDWFVIEADEYDTAFFDKRSKMVHYRPDVALVNNLEFDHADIFENIVDIQKQFHGMLRLVPENGLIICPDGVSSINRLLEMGTWSKVIRTNQASGLHCQLIEPSGNQFSIFNGSSKLADVNWNLIGEHNIQNALAVFAICLDLGIEPNLIAQALHTFKNVKRRMEFKGTINGVTVYDDFAHHPTAIASTIAGLKAKIGQGSLLVIVDFGSHTMKRGVMFEEVVAAVAQSNKAIFFNAPMTEKILPSHIDNCNSLKDLDSKLQQAKSYQHILVMSNKANQSILSLIEQCLQ